MRDPSLHPRAASSSQPFTSYGHGRRHGSDRQAGTGITRPLGPARTRAQAVVRLCEPEYDAAAFHAGGVAVADLPFEDCTTPPADVVGK